MGEKSPIFPKNLTKKVIIMEKEYLYVGFYTDTEEKFVLKIGTTKDLKRRQGEHNRNYKRAKTHTMPKDGSFQYLWTLPLSKWNTHRFEESNIALWQEMGIGEYVRNDRFILDNVPNFVPVKIRKIYQVALA